MMSIKSEETARRMARFRAALTHSGVKMTHQRLEIFREMARSSEHPDAEEIYRHVRKRLPTVSLDTVYRTLWLLVDLGLIATLEPLRERVRFDGDTSHHHHFVCVGCGMARDFRSDEMDSIRIPDAARGFGSVDRMSVQVTGTCLRCSARKGGGRRASRREGRR